VGLLVDKITQIVPMPERRLWVDIVEKVRGGTHCRYLFHLRTQYIVDKAQNCLFEIGLKSAKSAVGRVFQRYRWSAELRGCRSAPNYAGTNKGQIHNPHGAAQLQRRP
jgi:hypothetical protein